MRIFEFLRRETAQPWTAVIVLTVLSGVVNGAILALINAGSAAAASDTISLRLLLMFLIAICTFILTKRISLIRSVRMVEAMVSRLRLRICDQIRHSELQFVEKIGKGQLFTTIVQDTNLISQSAFLVANATQQIIMLLFGLVYIAYLSRVALVIVLSCLTVAVLLFKRQERGLLAELGKQAVLEGEFVEALNHIIDGFKEVRLNSHKNRALYRWFEELSSRTQALKTKTGVGLVTGVMFSQVFFYSLLAIVVFLLPRYVESARGVVMELTTAILFIMAPIEMVVGAFPVIARSNVALDRLYRLENDLEEHLTAASRGDAQLRPLANFRSASLDRASFRYRNGGDVPGFTVGPLDISIMRGHTLFIVGGNGSGKSTLMKMLTGLYPLSSGYLRVDGSVLVDSEVPAYRELISAIFADFHLFDRLYGLEGINEERIHTLLGEMGLTGKTDFKAGRFTNLNLSTGQRKRLALIIALLEDRDIYVFDEWAADQDVEFREVFYKRILRA